MLWEKLESLINKNYSNNATIKKSIFVSKVKKENNKFILDTQLNTIAQKYKCFIKEVNYDEESKELTAKIDGNMCFEARVYRI